MLKGGRALVWLIVLAGILIGLAWWLQWGTNSPPRHSGDAISLDASLGACDLFSVLVNDDDGIPIRVIILSNFACNPGSVSRDA